MTQGDRDLIERLRALAQSQADYAPYDCEDDSIELHEAADRLASQAAEIERLMEALSTCDDAIREYFRYFYGGEMRGSYDGKPERVQLQKAGHAATQALKGTGADHG